jgi:hypothetical protein
VEFSYPKESIRGNKQHMKNNMKTSLLLILLLAAICLGAQSVPKQAQWRSAPQQSTEISYDIDWLTQPQAQWRPAPKKSGDIASDSEWVIQPRTDIYEVIPSRMESSWIRDLPETGFKEITQQMARSATGHYYTCPSGKRPFLIRAVYSRGGVRSGIGGFRAERRGNSLAVIWVTLPILLSEHDFSQEPLQSAIVVNLDFTPDEIYNETSGFR